MKAESERAAWAQEFRDSMPRSYRAAYDDAASTAHAQAAAQRKDAVAHVELIASSRGAPGALCVVADDRPGLLAKISAAFVLAGIEVIDAEAHTRRTSAGRAEAVDLFWVRRANPARRDEPLTEADIADVHAALLGLLEGRVDEAAVRRPEVDAGTPTETTVRFVEDEDGALCVLEVETDDRSGLLWALTSALSEQQVQIEKSEVKTNGTRVRDRFNIMELDGAPISDERRLQIQVGVLAAVDPTKR